jgi:hypothetical protein
MSKQHELVIELARDLRILKQEEPVWRNTIDYYVGKHKEILLEAVSDGYGEGGSKGKIWSYAGCLLFAVSLLTTLGKMNLISTIFARNLFLPYWHLLSQNTNMKQKWKFLPQ